MALDMPFCQVQSTESESGVTLDQCRVDKDLEASMAFLDFLYRNGLWISVPLFAVGLGLLISSIKNVIRLRVEKQILSVSLVEQQHIEFGEAGRVVLCIEGPLFTNRFAKVEFELRAGDGTPLKGRTTLFHARSSTFSSIRMEMKSYEVPMPGSYELRMLNLGMPQPKDKEHQVVFMKPHLAQTIIYIVCIILSSFICIGSIVLFLLRLLLYDANT
jgi:hypothetical protein